MELVLVPGARPVDLLRRLNESRPQVVHFSSHGGPDEILLEAEGSQDEDPDLPGATTRSATGRDMKKVARDEGEGGGRASQGQPQPLRGSALVDVLRSCDEGNLRLVVLNACDTRPQAEALTEVVDCVVSMNREITDRAAIKFAASFYGALAYGRSVRKAFDQGVARLRAEGIAEAGTPELLVRAGVDASRVVLVGAAPERPSRRPPRRRSSCRSRGTRTSWVGTTTCPAARQPLSAPARRHPPAGPDRHGRHRQDPARRRIRLPPQGRLSRRHLLGQRRRAAR